MLCFSPFRDKIWVKWDFVKLMPVPLGTEYMLDFPAGDMNKGTIIYHGILFSLESISTNIKYLVCMFKKSQEGNVNLSNKQNLTFNLKAYENDTNYEKNGFQW